MNPAGLDISPAAEPTIQTTTGAGGATSTINSSNNSVWPSPKAVPKRKLSVFSHNGFPNLQLLEKQHQQDSTNQPRSASDAAIGASVAAIFRRSSQDAIGGDAAAAILNAMVQQREDTIDRQRSKNNSNETDVSNQNPNLEAATGPIAQVSAQQTTTTTSSSSALRSIRSDTLGSNASSRASSCDEPTISIHGSSSSSSGFSSAASSTSLSTPVASLPEPANIVPGPTEMTTPEAASTKIQRKITPTMMMTANLIASSSTSSLDSWSAGPSESPSKLKPITAMVDNSSERQQATKTTMMTRSERISKRHSFFAAAPPFESIKVQLEKQKNSKVDAQYIQQHIDKLISQNESIMENWSSVSIRSYNSSRDWPNSASASNKKASISSSSTETTPATTATSDLAQQTVSGLSSVRRSSGSSGTETSHNIRAKRWSTAMLLSHSNTNTGVGSRSVCNNRTTLPNPPSHNRQNFQQQSQLQQQQQQQLPAGQVQKQASLTSSSSASSSRPTSPRSASLVSAATSTGSLLGLSNQNNINCENRRHQDPSHLESAIENLSLKRNENSVPLNLNHYLQGQQQQQRRLDSSGNLSLSNALSQKYHQEQRQEEQEREREQEQQRAMLMAAILLDQQRQCSLAEQQALSLENQAAMLRQQEQQRFQQQLAAALQPFPYDKQVAMMASIPHLMAIQQQQQQQQQTHDQQHPMHQRSTSYSTVLAAPTPHHHQVCIDSDLLEGRLAGELLAKLRPCNEPDHPQLMAHGGEMLTQSLDSTKPSYKCEACAISFWTRDLLAYHSLTQCSARLIKTQQPPPTFNFYDPNNFDHHYQRQQQQQRQFQISSQSHLQLSKSVSPAASVAAEVSSILKNQLMTQAVAADKADAAGCGNGVDVLQLPFKKRKISEPNMRY